MRYLVILILLFCSCSSCDSGNSSREKTASVSKGEFLFRINCATCHKPDDDLVGPALKGVTTRWKDKKSLYDFVRNPIEALEKDSYAKNLQNRYHGVVMTAYPNLTDQDIDAILEFCGN